MKIIQCKNVCKTYLQGKIEVHALSHINLDINNGDLVSLSGVSGSGKTTLLNLIGGLDSITSGEIFFKDYAIHQLNSSQLADLRLNQIGFVFQAYNLIPVLSARENVEFIMQLQGVDAATRKQKSMAILEQVGLAAMSERRPSELSGGQQQRVAIARAIVNQPDLVLADEPTANLDRSNSRDLLSLMQTLNQELGTTFIISSHDDLVQEFTTRQVILEDGKIIHD